MSEMASITEADTEEKLDTGTVAEEIDELSEGADTAEEDTSVSALGDEGEAGSVPDVGEIIERELNELRREFPELKDIRDITELENPMRYAALRDLGLTAREAYLATSERRARRDNRSHLSPAAPKRAGSPTGGMSREELLYAREIFSGMNDAEIQSLYRRVAK